MSSCSDDGGASEVWVGWVGVVIAVAFFGSNFIPVKKFDTGDGEYAPPISGEITPTDSVCVCVSQGCSSSGCCV